MKLTGEVILDESSYEDFYDEVRSKVAKEMQEKRLSYEEFENFIGNINNIDKALYVAFSAIKRSGEFLNNELVNDRLDRLYEISK